MTVSPDGSLMISNLNIADEGNYTAKIQSDKSDDIYVIMKIYEKVGKPTITASISNPKENDTVTLTCTSTHAERIVWSRVPSGATLSSDNRTISFSMINRSDAGDYSCTAANPVSKDNSDSFQITVAYGPENVNINVRIISASSVSLECSANSVPPSTYHWKRNGTDIKDKPNPLQVDQMKDEGTYTCVATNSVTKLTATHSTYVNATIGQTIPSAAAPEPPELEYADIVFSKNMPKRQQPAPETVYANRAALAHPPDVVYSDLRLNRP
ncbi:PREDICTED: carcinoembryonic antigen-related cell adhesion molecule 1-like [Nanorana parkeri]|uniref:carcinoembryonic antigen-related cell adhesion molecule 1-like n=1 Tax=Nanorana parkeri TaxID=125878 RepID=UPI000853FA7F|nr:PREDICTED: carcinoembryonic antigen-related cell adhesion molecule 1-like [Nanorana parkeri]